ncbi:MAG TPA: hypothetical protein PLQ90_04065 [Sphaerochaeta sp.]|nr:hypothetical protein [Sphaerochaeta sp.]
MAIRKLVLMAILLTCVGTAYSAITATYTPQSSLVFKLGPDIQTANTPAGKFGSDKLVAHIGTLSISFEASDYFRRPYLDTSGFSRPYYFRGMFNTWGGGLQNTEFYIYAYTSLSSTPFALWLENGSMALAGDSENVLSASPFVVDFFFVSHHDAQYYQVGSSYQMVSGSLGTFQVTRLIVPPDNGTRSTVNVPVLHPANLPPNEPIPIIGDSQDVVVPPSIPYGGTTPPPQGHYLLSIVDVMSFPIQQAYGDKRLAIATCQLTLQNVHGNNKKKVFIKFSSTSYINGFQLHLTDSPGLYVIPYSLYFLGHEVVSGQDILWKNLKNGLNEQTISVGNIDSTTAEMAPAGTYKDVIYVEVRPFN